MQPIPTVRSRRGRAVGVTVALLVLLAIVAVAMQSGFGGSSHAVAAPSHAYVDWAMSIFLVLFFLMIPVALYAHVVQMREFPLQDPRTMRYRAVRSMLSTAGVFLVLALILYSRRHSTFFGFHSLFGGHAGSAAGGSHGGTTPQYEPTFRWPVLWATALLLAAAAAWYLWDRSHRVAPARAFGAASVAEDLADSLDDAIDDLEAELDARRAVIAAYARMERTFAGHGLDRRPSETPTEYLRRLLLGLTSQVDAVRRLTRLFEHARFSDHTIGDAMKRDAIESLRAIRDELRSTAS